MAFMTHTIIHWDLWSFSIEVVSPYQHNTESGVDKMGTDENEITTAKDESVANNKYRGNFIGLTVSSMKWNLLCLEKTGNKDIVWKAKPLLNVREWMCHRKFIAKGKKTKSVYRGKELNACNILHGNALKN